MVACEWWFDFFNRLTSGAFLLPAGKVADVFGRKRIFVATMAAFSLTLLITGFATSPIFMDVCSGVLGVFAAGTVPPAVGALGTVYHKPSKRKNRAFACFSAGNPLGFVGGMIISGIAAEFASWRVSFWALCVVYAVFTLFATWTMPKEQDHLFTSIRELWKKCDPLGMLLSMLGIGLVSASLS